MERGFYKYYKDLPPYAKGILIVGGGVVLALLGMKAYKSLFPSVGERQSREFVRNVDDEVGKYKKQGQKQSFADSQYNSYANDIYEGMRYAVGDNYDNVERILLLMNNDLDVAKLIKSFGVRQDYAFGIPTGNAKDLITFVNSELGEDYLGLTRYRVNNINANWKKKGIKYQF
jgi:hypothetical protein